MQIYAFVNILVFISFQRTNSDLHEKLWNYAKILCFWVARHIFLQSVIKTTILQYNARFLQIL